jgi:hypothetical protein
VTGPDEVPCFWPDPTAPTSSAGSRELVWFKMASSPTGSTLAVCEDVRRRHGLSLTRRNDSGHNASKDIVAADL